MAAEWNALMVLVGRTDGKRLLAGHSRRYEKNVKMDLREI
jgi:hypothetical protein